VCAQLSRGARAAHGRGTLSRSRQRWRIAQRACAAWPALLIAGAGCTGRNEQRDSGGTTPAVHQPASRATAPMQPAPGDTAAMLAAFRQLAQRIDRDTVRYESIQKPIALGAGTTGLLSAWRLGRVWQRVAVQGSGAGFRSVDTYWFSNGALLGARLEMTRGDRKPVVDEVWFRDRALYRWTDREGRHLEPDARSTQYEVRMLRERLDVLMRTLEIDEIARERAR
jgi:hypothetical protein